MSGKIVWPWAILAVIPVLPDINGLILIALKLYRSQTTTLEPASYVSDYQVIIVHYCDTTERCRPPADRDFRVGPLQDLNKSFK